MPFEIRHAPARSILTPTCGFIAQAGFTHSLSPARNCTFGCTYCYVPTMRIYGGLKPEDWSHWGRFTTFKSNAADLLPKSLRADQVIYCSPLVDPYQPAEAGEALMPRLLDALIKRPPRVFVRVGGSLRSLIYRLMQNWRMGGDFESAGKLDYDLIIGRLAFESLQPVLKR